MTTRSCHNNKMVDIGSRTGDQIIDSFSESTSWHHLCHLFPPHHYHYLASSAYCNNITFIFTLTLSHLPQIRDYQYSEVIRSYPNTPINQTSSDTPLQLLHLPVSFTTYLPTYLGTASTTSTMASTTTTTTLQSFRQKWFLSTCQEMINLRASEPTKQKFKIRPEAGPKATFPILSYFVRGSVKSQFD